MNNKLVIIRSIGRQTATSTFYTLVYRIDDRITAQYMMTDESETRYCIAGT